MIVYADASSLLKLVVPERESAATRELLDGAQRLVTSELAGTEMRRVHHRLGLGGGEEAAASVLTACDVVRLTPDLLETAAAFPDADLGTLDAIHLATALRLGDRLDRFVTHDTTLAAVAERHDLPVVTPT